MARLERFENQLQAGALLAQRVGFVCAALGCHRAGIAARRCSGWLCRCAGAGGPARYLVGPQARHTGT